MRAVRFTPDSGLQLVECPTPVMASDEVLLRVDACGVCGSDRQVIQGESVPQGTVFPVILGHEIAGTVIAVGPDVSLWNAGDRAIVHPFLSCQTCAACLHGQPNLCIRQSCVGFTRDGGFAELVAVPAMQLVRCPAGVSSTAAALLVDAYATPFRAFIEGGMKEGLTVLVMGTGGLGLAALQLARAFDAGKVASITRRKDGVDTAQAFGADTVVEMTQDDRNVARALRRWSGSGGIDIVIDTVAEASTVRLAMDVLRPGGTVVMVGMSPDEVTIPIAKAVRRGIRVVGSYGSTKGDVETLVGWTRVDRLDPTALVAEQISLDEVDRAFAPRRMPGRCVIVPQGTF